MDAGSERGCAIDDNIVPAQNYLRDVRSVPKGICTEILILFHCWYFDRWGRVGDSVLLKYIGNSMRYTYVDCTENMTYVHDNWTESWTRVGWNECK